MVVRSEMLEVDERWRWSAWSGVDSLVAILLGCVDYKHKTQV